MKTVAAILMVFVLLASGCNTQYTSHSVTQNYGPNGEMVSQTTSDMTFEESNLANKSLATGGAVTALKVITSTDPSTGSWFPQFILGFGTFFFFDLPAGVTAMFKDVQKSLWSSTVASETTIVIIGTDSKFQVEISDPELLIDIPGVKVFNPLSDKIGVKATNSKGESVYKTLPRMKEMPKLPSGTAPVNNTELPKIPPPQKEPANRGNR